MYCWLRDYASSDQPPSSVISSGFKINAPPTVGIIANRIMKKIQKQILLYPPNMRSHDFSDYFKEYFRFDLF
jgi:hypothetical protein